MNTFTARTMAILAVVTFLSLGIKHPVPAGRTGQVSDEPNNGSVQEETVPPPTFYRSGEMIETDTAPPPPAETPQNVFEVPEPAVIEEVPQEEPGSVFDELPAEGTEVLQGEPAGEEAPANEEPAAEESAPKKSAPKQSLMFRLMDRLKYLIAAIGLGIGGGVYLLGKKKKIATPKTQAAVPQGESLAVPAAGPQAVEETSKRLEHALSAIEGQNQ